MKLAKTPAAASSSWSTSRARPLDRLIKRRTLGLDEAIGLATEIADALTAAHAKGIIHRDIKPGNVIVTSRGQAKVMDFGLASVAVAQPSDQETRSQLTDYAAAAGTVPYMSPEQLKGEPIDGRSDIFSFGVMLYEAVCGRRPFSAESAVATASEIISSEPPPVARYRDAVPEELQRILRKCLEKDRSRRYQSAADLTLDLETLGRAALSGSAMELPRTSGRPARLWRVAVAAALTAVLASVAWSIFRPRSMPAAPVGVINSIAVFPFVNSAENPGADYLSDGITESLINNFSRLSPLRVIARTTMFRYKGREVDPRAIGRELGVDAALTGRIFQRGDTLAIQADLMRVSDGLQLWGDRFDRKFADVLAIQDEIARQIAERLRGRLTNAEQQVISKRFTQSSEAYDLYLKGRFLYGNLTEKSVEESLSLYHQAIARDPNYALAYVGLANSYFRLGSVFGFRSPREVMPRGLELLNEALRLDPDLADAHAALATYKLTYEWNLVEAEREIKRALDLNPSDAAARALYGSFYQAQSRFDDAIAERRARHSLDPLSPLATADVGYPYYYARRYDDAIAHFRKALDLDPGYSWAYLWIGQAYVQAGRYAEAIEAIGRAVQLSGGDTRARATLGHAYGMAGRRADAVQVLNDLNTLAATTYVSPYFIALVHAGLKDADRTLTFLDAAYAERHPFMILLRVEPIFDWLRSDARFAALEKRIGLTK